MYSDYDFNSSQIIPISSHTQIHFLLALSLTRKQMATKKMIKKKIK